MNLLLLKSVCDGVQKLPKLEVHQDIYDSMHHGIVRPIKELLLLRYRLIVYKAHNHFAKPSRGLVYF
jgi:hypothetical protein